MMPVFLKASVSSYQVSVVILWTNNFQSCGNWVGKYFREFLWPITKLDYRSLDKTCSNLTKRRNKPENISSKSTIKIQ